MAINPTNIATKNILENDYNVVIQMLGDRPISGQYYDEEKPPNRLCGWYNQETDKVELYLTDYTGRRYLRAG